jgi:hypothetical protein
MESGRATGRHLKQDRNENKARRRREGKAESSLRPKNSQIVARQRNESDQIAATEVNKKDQIAAETQITELQSTLFTENEMDVNLLTYFFLTKNLRDTVFTSVYLSIRPCSRPSIVSQMNCSFSTRFFESFVISTDNILDHARSCIFSNTSMSKYTFGWA